MSLEPPAWCFGVCGFPRVSGDEPTPWETLKTLQQFSPRERG